MAPRPPVSLQLLPSTAAMLYVIGGAKLRRYRASLEADSAVSAISAATGTAYLAPQNLPRDPQTDHR